MSTESDTDPENSGVHISASLRDVLFDPVFACAAAAAGSPTGVTLFRTLSGRLRSVTSSDIAEQILKALEMISKRNGKQILIADDIGASFEWLVLVSSKA
ncbi:unnamed protein product [Rotaria sordida]|uniref:Uncharacterized protein n=1 Tax=Rotaria sordida TaxID=392033 RepID=A0A820A006_9BILA|nr:unnamed protein product [Rotaria sordida]